MKRWRSWAERRARMRRRELIAAGLLAGYLLLRLVDKPIFVHFQYGVDAGDGSWGMMFKTFGFLPLWILVGATIWLGAARGGGASGLTGARALLVVLSAAASGLVAEFLKRMIGRERPWTGPALPADVDPAAAEGVRVLEIGDTVHKPFLHGWVDDHNLGFPSSHAAVAFGATIMAIRFWPAAWPVFAIAGFGCAWQRLATEAHFLTDVYGALAIGWVVSAWLFGMMNDER